MHKMQLGSWRFESGNACHATLELTRPSGLTIGFTWKTSLMDADRDRYLCEILPDALRLAMHEVDGLADITKMCRGLESEGLLESRVNEDGDTEWRATEKGIAKFTPQTRGTNSFWSRIRNIGALNWLISLRPGS